MDIQEREAISNIFVRPCKNCGHLKGIVSVNFHGLVVREIKIIEGAKGLFLNMPCRKRGDEWIDVCFFLDVQAREEVTRKVLAEYEKVKADFAE